jgi:TonB family protein
MSPVPVSCFPPTRLFLLAGLAVLLGLGSCAPGQSPVETEPVLPVVAVDSDLQETPVPDGDWRPHRLSSCSEDLDVPKVVERYLGICSEYYRDGSGSDGMIEMEFGLADGHRHTLMLLTLGQLYLMAGQGDPDLLPVEGPAADVGDWDRNRVRLLRRAEDLFLEAAATRTDDAAVDYLLADVSRARGDLTQAAELVASGMTKCTGGRSFGTLWQYQQLNKYPPLYLGGPSPVYPQKAVEKGVTGDVIIDVLLSPAGEVRQLVVVQSPAASLTKAASDSLRKGGFDVARVGKYPIWSWIRVTTAFNLES